MSKIYHRFWKTSAEKKLVGISTMVIVFTDLQCYFSSILHKLQILLIYAFRFPSHVKNIQAKQL